MSMKKRPTVNAYFDLVEDNVGWRATLECEVNGQEVVLDVWLTPDYVEGNGRLRVETVEEPSADLGTIPREALDNVYWFMSELTRLMFVRYAGSSFQCA